MNATLMANVFYLVHCVVNLADAMVIDVMADVIRP